MDAIDKGQVTSSAAEIYETFFVPALFEAWAHKVTQIAQIKQGDHVLDVACGTGILARVAYQQVGETGSVTGLDVNAGMLSVAKRKNADIDWQLGNVESMPFEDDTFDVIVSQYGMMFFENKKTAVNEMVRVLKPGGKLIVAVWDTLENTPGYASMVQLIDELFGERAANGLRSPYVLGDVTTFKAPFDHPQLKAVTIQTLTDSAHFDSIEKWVHTDIKGWVLSDEINDAQFSRLLDAAQTRLQAYVLDDGTVSFPTPAHILSATKS